jgi:hypothetical protein
MGGRQGRDRSLGAAEVSIVHLISSGNRLADIACSEWIFQAQIHCNDWTLHWNRSRSGYASYGPKDRFKKLRHVASGIITLLTAMKLFVNSDETHCQL